MKPIVERGLGVDCVSMNEVRLALEYGFPLEKMIFSGSGKRVDELRDAIVTGIGCLNVESVQELEMVAALASELTTSVNVSLRIVTENEVDTHRYLTTGMRETKFGILQEELPLVFEILNTRPFLQFVGIHFHIGSQIRDMKVFTHLAQVANEMHFS